MIEEGEDPPEDAPSKAEGFFAALERNEQAVAVGYLRQLKSLSREDVVRLADLLDGDPFLTPFYKYKLILKRRRAGNSSATKLEQRARSQARARRLEYEIQKIGDTEAAVATIAAEHKVSRSTLFADLKAFRRLNRQESPTKK